MSEPIDEYCIQQITDFKDHKLVSITKEGLELPSSEEDKDRFNTLKTDYELVCTKIKEMLDGKIESVTVSTLLNSSPCCIVTGNHGWSANMERIMKAQALRDNNSMGFMMSKKHLEINPSHPIINRIRDQINDNEDNISHIKSLVYLIYDTALLTSGFTLEEPTVFANRMYNIIQLGLGINPDDETIPENHETIPENHETIPENHESHVPQNNSETYKSYSNNLDNDALNNEDMEHVD